MVEGYWYRLETDETKTRRFPGRRGHVGSGTGRLATFRLQVFLSPPTEPEVHVPAHPALRVFTL
jgi:hypothetical protein